MRRAGFEGVGEVDEDGAGVAGVFERGGAEEDLVDVEGVSEVDLDAGGVGEHLKADGVFAGDELLVRVDADAEVVVEEVVVGAIGAVGSAEDVGVGGCARVGLRGRGGGAWLEEGVVWARAEHARVKLASVLSARRGKGGMGARVARFGMGEKWADSHLGRFPGSPKFSHDFVVLKAKIRRRLKPCKV